MTISRRARAAAVAGAIALAALPAIGTAQSAQPWSLQASVLAASQQIGGSAVSGVGFEGQFRYTPAALWSVGVGFQSTSHPSGDQKIDITGGFLEPRYTIDIGSDRVAPYLAARLAYLHQSSTLDVGAGNLVDFSSAGSAFGAGAGLLIRGTSRINIDIGAAFVRQSFGTSTSDDGHVAKFAAFTGYVAKAGFSLGFGSR